MKITILAIGKKHDPKLQAAVEDYASRLEHYVKLSWQLVEAKLTNGMTEKQIRDTESIELLRHFSDSDTVVVLDERGDQFSSTQFAQQLQSYMNRSKKKLVFVIGGAHGVNQVLLKRADLTWSLSKQVFPHQLVRLILIEQIYRAYTILAGEQYHHQ